MSQLLPVVQPRGQGDPERARDPDGRRPADGQPPHGGHQFVHCGQPEDPGGTRQRGLVHDLDRPVHPVDRAHAGKHRLDG